jgi:STE24 endopeptidase
VFLVCAAPVMPAQQSGSAANSASGAPLQLRMQPEVPTAAEARPLDVKLAADAWLAQMPRDQRARSDAYFEGGYWLILWDFLYAAAVCILLLATRASARMRDWAERITRFTALQTAIYFVEFIIAFSVLTFPLTIYEGFTREHKYGLSNMSFGSWMRDQVIGLVVALILGGIFVTALFAIVRKLGRTWWVWGALAGIVFTSFATIIAPVYIAPLFNTYTKLEDTRVKDPILHLARANGIPVTDVYETNLSRQTKRVSAWVFGFGNTQRVVLSDNLLNRCSLAEIKAVMGHEMGHYVMNHVYKGAVFFAVIIFIGFWFLDWGVRWSLARWGERWQVRGFTDVAVLPLAVLVLSLYGFALTPVQTTITRTMEYEADIFGLNAAGEPDGAAAVALKLGEYRKLDPGPLEEIVFYDHPSGRTRITAAMRWKAEHLPAAAPEAAATPARSAP